MANVSAELSARGLPFPDSPFTWAGEYRAENLLCFGTETGSLWFMDRGLQAWHAPVKIDECHSAINGVAFATNRWAPDRQLLAVSSCGEIVINKMSVPPGPGRELSLFDGGAHDVVATELGGLVAPRGPEGLLSIEALPDGRYQQREICANGAELYFYKVAPLGVASDGVSYFACAGRTDGVITVALAGDTQPVRIGRVRLLGPANGGFADIVDVCRIGSPDHPSAFVALGIDNSIYLFKDFSGRDSLTLNQSVLHGTAYSIMSAGGHLLIHTSDGLFAWPNVVKRFHRGERVQGKTKVLYVPVDAAQASLVYDEFVLLLEEDQVVFTRLDSLVSTQGGEATVTDAVNGRSDLMQYTGTVTASSALDFEPV